MAYNASLINRLQQFGKVHYDLVVVDDAGVMPLVRNTIAIPIAFDVPLRLNQIVNQAVARANAEQTVGARRQRLIDLRDNMLLAIQAAIDARNAFQDAIDAGRF